MFSLQPTVVSKSSNPGLSLLSRGIGEEKEQHGQTKLEVCLEPEDYHNIQGRRFYLPPLQQHAWAKEEKVSPREVRVHKTYTTRKGALLLYAEDLALTSQEGADGKKRSMEAEDSSYFNSISDLRNAVLSYGSGTRQQTFQPAASQVDPSHQPFLGFVHNKRSHGPYKTVRPGFSAKRYLANWSRSWDDSILNYLRSEGHIWDKNLFQQNVLAPNLYRRINDDLSLVPLPYRVTRNMLMSPGEFESLEFYRIRPDGADTGGYEDDEGYDADVDATEKGSKGRKKKKSIQKPFNLPGSIAMIVRDMEQKPHAVQYEQLDEEQQRQVLQRLLLQSALHQQQHLRIIREENEKKKEEETEMDEGEKDSANSSQKRPMPLLSGQHKQRRTDTDMTLYGSPTFQVPDAQDIDMEQAIANLITSNSTNILGGSTAFTDQTILDMYSAMKGKTKKPPAPPPSTSPSQWPQGSKRGRVKNNMYHTYPANFSGIQPLPPIQNSLEGNMGGGGDFMWPTPPPKQGTGPPVITMEPPTPQHPLLSGKSKFSQGWSSRSKTLSKSSVQSSSETNIWKADIDENDLLQEAEREDIENERASSDQEVWIKSPRSSTKGSSKKVSSKDSAVSKASKGESIVALSINSHFSQSMENLSSPVGDQNPRFPAAGSVPARLRESMRSHKGSGRGSSHGSVLLGDQGGDFLITGSKQGSSYAPSVDSLADNVPSPVESRTPQEPPSISQELPSIEPSESLEFPDASTLDAEEPGIFEEKLGVGSTDNVAGSPDDDDAHSVKTVSASLPSLYSTQDVVTNENFDSDDDESIWAGTIGAFPPTFSSLDKDTYQEIVKIDVEKGVKIRKIDNDSDKDGALRNDPVANLREDDRKAAEASECLNEAGGREILILNQNDEGNHSETEAKEGSKYQVLVTEGDVQVRENIKDTRGKDDGERQDDYLDKGNEKGASVTSGDSIENVDSIDRRSNSREPSDDGETVEDDAFAIDVQVTFAPVSIDTAIDRLLDDVIESVFDDSYKTIISDIIDTAVDCVIDVVIEDALDLIIETDFGEEDKDSESDIEDNTANPKMGGLDLGFSMKVLSYKKPKPLDYVEKWKRKLKRSLKEKTGSRRAADLRRKNEFLSEADDTKTTGRSVKLGQGVIDLTMSDPAGSVRDKMSEKRSLPSYSKKSSTQGSVKAESLQSGKDLGDLDVMQSFQNFSYKWKGKGSRRASKTSRDDDELGQLSDGEKEEEWPVQADQSKTGSVISQEIDQHADMSSKRRSSVAGSESEVEIEVEAAGDGNEENGGEPGEGGDNNSGLRTSSLLEPPASVAGSVRSRSGSVEAQLEQLVEAASVIVDEIMQRPKSGRDLAKDAMMAAEIWSTKLGELFAEENDPERVRSAPYRRRQNSLDEESVTSDMSSKQTKRSRRIHSAEAAVTLLRHLLKGSKSAEGKKEDDGAKDSGPLGFSMTNLGVAEKMEAEKTTLIVRAPPEPEKPVDDADAKLNDELAKIVAETGLLEKRGSKSKKGSMSTKTSTKSNKSSKSSKSKKSKDGEEEDDKDAFIVSLPKDSKADILLYKPMTPEPPKEEPKPPPKEKKKPIQKKTKKPAPKQEKPKKTKKPPKEPSESPKDNKEAEEEEAKLKAEKEKLEEEERKKKEEEEKAAKEAAEREGEEDEEEEDEGRASPESPEFIIVQDAPSLPPELPVDEIKLEPSVSAAPSEDYSEITDFTEDSTNEGPNSISRSQAKAFKRAAEAEKRKAAVEKKRRDRDEAKKRAQGEAERAERIKQEYEDEKKRKQAEALERAARAVEEREKLANQEEERKRQAALAAERERRQQAEYKRKMEEMARKKREEDMKRKAEEEQRRKEEEERMKIEAEMLAAMEEAERIEFEKRRKAEELEAARIAEEERIKREIEDKIAEEKARLLAIELAKAQKEVEARLAFNKELHSEANVFTHSQDMTRAFTWSYFELLEHLGIDIPDSLKDHYKEIAESKGDG